MNPTTTTPPPALWSNVRDGSVIQYVDMRLRVVGAPTFVTHDIDGPCAWWSVDVIDADGLHHAMAAEDGDLFSFIIH